MAGLTEQGFTPKTQAEIKSDIETKLKAFFGEDINLNPGSRFATIVDIFSFELADTWLALQADYNSRFRSTATGLSLDYVGSLTNCTRKFEKQSSVACYLGSVKSGVLIPTYSRAQISGGDPRQFYLNTDATVVATSFLVILSEAAISGTLKMEWEGTNAIEVQATDPVETIQTAIITALGLSSGDVTVIGSIRSSPAALHITFNSGAPAGLPKVSDSALLRYQSPVTVKSYFSTANNESFTGVDSTAEEIPPGSVQRVASSNNEWNAVINFSSGVPGEARETDGEYRLRMSNELSLQGTATFGGFIEQIASVGGVQSVNIIENDNTEPDAAGRPGHSFECYVEGGSDDEVAQAIYDYKPLGIKNTSVTTVGTVGNRVGSITTANGGSSTLSFSSPIQVIVFVKAVITRMPSFPTDGVALVKQALADEINKLNIGQELQVYKLYAPIASVTGIEAASVYVSVSQQATESDTANIDPNVNERLVTTVDYIEVEVLV